jgi:peptide/nickel transport system permease protein
MNYRYVTGRLGQGLVVLFGAVTISFVLTNVIGSPADVIGGAFMPPDQRQALNARLGYDDPLFSRFVHYIAGIVHGDFGISYRTNDSAIAQVMTALPNTLVLVVSSLLIALALALGLAVFSVRHRESRRDRMLRRTIGVLQGMPEFWLSLMLILVFSVQLRVLPSYGFYSPSSLILPAVALALPMIPTLFRLFRGQLLDVMGRDFVEAMRARGLSETVVVYQHGLRNILGPATTLVALQLGNLIAGALITEVIFSWPGIGNLAFSAVQARDFAVVQAIIIVIAVFYVLLNLAADLVVLVSDPRVRRGS